MSQPQQTHEEVTVPEDTDMKSVTETAITDQQNNHRYQCQFCETIYENEITARVHITRSDDEIHQNHNGLMPDTEIDILGKDGEVIDSVSRRPDEITVDNFSADQLPSEYPEHQRKILQIATQNPYEQEYTTLEDLIVSEFEELDLKIPSYSTIRRVVKEFYDPQSPDQAEAEDLDDLTPKQQAIIIAHTLLPDEPKSTIADRVGCASSYPAQVFDRAPHVVQQLGQKNDGDIVEAIQSELSEESIIELTSRELVADLPIEFAAIDDRNSEDVVTDSGDEDSNQQSLWGSPIENETGLRGVPEPEPDQSKFDSEEADSETQNSSQTDEEVLDAIADLHQELRFLSDIFAHAEPHQNTNLVTAVAEQVEERCESILRTHGDA